MSRVNGVRDVRGGVPGADGGDIRRVRRTAELGAEVTVSAANTVGLTLAIFIALLLAAALLYPEKF